MASWHYCFSRIRSEGVIVTYEHDGGKILAEALALAPQARAFVAERLIESLDASPGAEISPAWREEIQRRCREVDEGAVELRDAADVFARAYAALQ